MYLRLTRKLKIVTSLKFNTHIECNKCAVDPVFHIQMVDSINKRTVQRQQKPQFKFWNKWVHLCLYNGLGNLWLHLHFKCSLFPLVKRVPCHSPKCKQTHTHTFTNCSFCVQDTPWFLLPLLPTLNTILRFFMVLSIQFTHAQQPFCPSSNAVYFNFAFDSTKLHGPLEPVAPWSDYFQQPPKLNYH